MQICPPTSWACDVLQPFAHPRGYESCFQPSQKSGLRSQTLCCSYPDQISPPGGQHRFHGCCVSWAMGQHHMPLMSSSSLCVVLNIHGGKNAWQNKQMQRLHLCWKCSNCTKSIDCFQSKNWRKEILRSLDWSCQQHGFHLLRNTSLAYHCHVVHSKGGFTFLMFSAGAIWHQGDVSATETFWTHLVDTSYHIPPRSAHTLQEVQPAVLNVRIQKCSSGPTVSSNLSKLLAKHWGPGCSLE